LDDGEGAVYLDNLPSDPDKPSEPGKFPVFEIILWDEDMNSMEWQVIGVWTGEDTSDAVILRDTKDWW
jgi:hypothetical protein